MLIYVVEEGDNVDQIASSVGVPVDVLIYDNQIEYPYRLAVGQALFIRGEERLRKPVYPGKCTGKHAAMAYGYLCIFLWVYHGWGFDTAIQK